MDKWFITVLINGRDIKFIEMVAGQERDRKAVVNAIETQAGVYVEVLELAHDCETASVWTK